MQRDITEIRRDIRDSHARAALSYEQSEQRAAASRAKMYQKTDELVERVSATESAVGKLSRHDQRQGSDGRSDALEADGARRRGCDGHGGGGSGILITAYWSDIWHVVRRG